MNVNASKIQTVKEFRAVNDPIILHERTMEWFDGDSTPSEEDIYEARRALIDEYPLDEPIPKATWGEVVAYCFTASMDAAAINAEFVGIYEYAFTQFLESMGMDSDEMLPDSYGFYPGLPATDEPLDLEEDNPQIVNGGLEEHVTEHGSKVVTDRHRELAESLREDIKQDLDKHFVSELYDAADRDFDVPKVFWKDAAVATTGDETGNSAENSGSGQTGLDMF
ncbi:hypothetical protein [Salinibaculum rarum]|uniref:hypothetical protein n=1 Tax=Salinibaculum rarum TaxID=3058903 RepID=UPI00265E56DE|nr:hypothetical protein [Salinibaculum sp. KK48]